MCYSWIENSHFHDNSIHESVQTHCHSRNCILLSLLSKHAIKSILIDSTASYLLVKINVGMYTFSRGPMFTLHYRVRSILGCLLIFKSQ